MKKNRLLMGLGIGLIMSVLLLELLYIAQGSTVNWTEEEVRAAANQLDLEVYPRSEIRYTQDQLDSAIQDALNQRK